MIPSDADDYDDGTAIIQLQTSEGDYIYSSRQKCPFTPDDFSLVNNGVMMCTMMYMTISEHRVNAIIYIHLYFANTGIFRNSNVRHIFKREKCTFVEIIKMVLYILVY